MAVIRNKGNYISNDRFGFIPLACLPNLQTLIENVLFILNVLFYNRDCRKKAKTL